MQLFMQMPVDDHGDYTDWACLSVGSLVYFSITAVT